ncbi:MAG: hypothetical protein KGL39_36575 [Patescibacteria group bacterium]|nr:hypothetical protein [Patescibacteria group bacterium]
MISYGALQPDGAWSPTMNAASGIGSQNLGGPNIGLGSLMALLRSNMGSSATGTPNAPAAASGTPGAAQNRLYLNNTVQGYKAPGGGSGASGGANAWLPGGTPNFGPIQGRWTGGPGGDLVQQPQPGSPWFQGQGQGFTFFGQQTPTQVGTNQFVWGNPNIPGMNGPQPTTPAMSTDTLQNIMQMLSGLQNNVNTLQQQRTTQPVAQQAPPAPNVTSPWYANTGYQDPSVWGAGA